MGRNQAPTAKQTKFAEGLASGLSKTQAYALAHPNDKSNKLSLRNEASRASRSPAVIAEVQRLWREPIILDQFPQYSDPKALRAHAIATMARLTQHPDGTIAMQAARWLYDYANGLGAHPETTADRTALLSDLRSLYQKALKQAPLVETVLDSEDADPEIDVTGRPEP